MPVHVLDPQQPDPAIISSAAAQLRAGGLVAFPTETVYGLGAHALDPAAVARIFAAKGRPAWNPLIVHVSDVDAARRLVTDWPPEAARLAEHCWPGPLTLILPRAAHIPDTVTAGLPSVAIRIPSHPVAQALLRAAQIPVAAPSANRFTELSPTTAAHVVQGLGNRVDFVLDGGACAVGIESTVLDLTGATPTVRRPGVLSASTLAEVLGRPVAEAVANKTASAPHPSPGMAERHYAPRAPVWLFHSSEMDAITDAVRAHRASRNDAARPPRIGALLLPSAADMVPLIDDPRVMPTDPAQYAQALYATLHALDAAGCTLLLVQRPPTGSEWVGVVDRLTRAAHPAPR